MNDQLWKDRGFGKHKPRWSIKVLRPGWRRFWFQCFTPVYHMGRGPYVTVGLYFIAIYRGY